MVEFKEIKYLGDIKSLYIIKGIFLFLNEKQKLNMIIYNKQLQKLLGVDITDYKKIKSKINSIKSPGILKIVFSFLDEKQKLNMIMYNKKLQNKLDIDIEIYKKKKWKI